MKKNILILLFVFSVLFFLALKWGVPYAANKVLLEKTSSQTENTYTWGKISFSLFAFEIVIPDFRISQVYQSKNVEILKVEELVLKRVDLFNGANPEFLECELKGVSLGVNNGFSLGIEPLLQSEEGAFACDVLLKLNKGEQDKYFLSCELGSENLETCNIEVEVNQFQFDNWQKAIVEELSITLVDEKRVAAIVEDEMKRQKVTSREALFEKLQKSVGFALTVDNLGRNYFDLSPTGNDEEKRLLLKKEVLTLLKDGRGITIEYNKRKDMAVRLGELSQLSIRDLAESLDYSLTVVR